MKLYDLRLPQASRSIRAAMVGEQGAQPQSMRLCFASPSHEEINQAWPRLPMFAGGSSACLGPIARGGAE
jgi:hypothetical protein